jgi:hypothetical protein
MCVQSHRSYALEMLDIRNRHEGRAIAQAFFFILVCEAIGTVATPGLLCQPRLIVWSCGIL